MAVNWDKLNVGRMDLNHSEGFFDKRHLEHERLENLFQEKLQIIKGKNDEIKAKEQAKKKKGNKENVEVKTGNEKGMQKQVEATIKSMQKVAQGMTLRSHKQTILTTVTGSRLMNYANVYEQHKKELLEKKKQEEEKKTSAKPFKARPAPKFVRATTTTTTTTTKPVKEAPVKPAPISHKPKPPVAHVAPVRRATTSTTHEKPKPKQKPEKPEIVPKKRVFVPSVSRVSVTVQQKKTLPAPPKPEIKKFVAHVPKYLHKEPFKVKKAEKKQPTEVKPFKLSIATRIDDRHKSDAERRKIVDERNKKLQEEKQKKEEEEIKALRKLREFRASVNPFNKVKVGKKPAVAPIKETPEVPKA